MKPWYKSKTYWHTVLKWVRDGGAAMLVMAHDAGIFQLAVNADWSQWITTQNVVVLIFALRATDAVVEVVIRKKTTMAIS